ncbi:hypothetical protein TNCV_331011 [Trichonephila clavipes]|nr:hypothetical protein TNCV_331011 [Trichonephila clavipes]
MKGVMSSGLKKGNKRSHSKPYASEHSRIRRTKDCRKRSSKIGVMAMSAEVTAISAMRSSTIDTWCSIQKQLQVAPEEKYQRIGVRGSWRLSNRSSASNPLTPGKRSMKVISHHNRKMCCCTTAQWPVLPAANTVEMGNLHTFRLLQPYQGIPNPSILMAIPLVWLIVLSMATIITISTDGKCGRGSLAFKVSNRGWLSRVQANYH